jgi:hypothetical protein
MTSPTIATPTLQELEALGQARATAHGALDTIHSAKADARHQLEAAGAASTALQTQHEQLALDVALSLDGAQGQLEAVERRAEELQREMNRARRVIASADARIPAPRRRCGPPPPSRPKPSWPSSRRSSAQRSKRCGGAWTDRMRPQNRWARASG